MQERARNSVPVQLDGEDATLPVDLGRRVERVDEAGFSSPQFSAYEAALREVVRLADSVGAPVAVVHLTTASVVYAPYLREPDDVVELDVRSHERIAEWLAEIGRSEGFSYWDTAGALQAATARRPILYEDHLTQAGHRQLAESLIRWLSEDGLLP